MWYLTSNRNNVDLKKVLPGWKTQADIDIGNTIEHDVKSYQYLSVGPASETPRLIQYRVVLFHTSDIGLNDL